MATIPFSAVPWTSPEPGFWTGTSGGIYFGSVESSGDRFRARDAADYWLGDYPTLRIARAIVEAA